MILKPYHTTEHAAEKNLDGDDSPPQGLKPSLILCDLRGAEAPLHHSAAGFS